MRPIISLTYRSTDLLHLLDLTERAERVGAAGTWIAETWREPIVPVAAACARTSRMPIGAGMAQIFPLNPVVAAQQAAHLQQLSGDRYSLGVALGSPVAVPRWFGVQYERPLKRMEEFIRVFKGAVRGDGERGFSFDGEIYNIRRYRPAVEVTPPPVNMAAVGPKMLRLAGRVADGPVIGGVHSEAYEERALGLLGEGSEMEGRDPGEVELFYFLPCSVSSDAELARENARTVVAFQAQYPHYRRRYEEEGYGQAAERVAAALRDHDYDAARKATPDEWIDRFAVAGTVEDCKRQLHTMADRYSGTAVLYMVPYGVPEDQVNESVALTIDNLLGHDYGTVAST